MAARPLQRLEADNGVVRLYRPRPAALLWPGAIVRWTAIIWNRSQLPGSVDDGILTCLPAGILLGPQGELGPCFHWPPPPVKRRVARRNIRLARPGRICSILDVAEAARALICMQPGVLQPSTFGSARS